MSESILRTFEEAAKAITHRAFDCCVTTEQVEKAAYDVTTIVDAITNEMAKGNVMTAYERGLFVAFAKGYLHKYRAEVMERVSKRLVVTVFV